MAGMEIRVSDGVARYIVSASAIQRYGGIPIPLSLVSDSGVQLIVAECPLAGVEYVMEHGQAVKVAYRSGLNPNMWVAPKRCWATRVMHGAEQSALFEK